MWGFFGGMEPEQTPYVDGSGGVNEFNHGARAARGADMIAAR
jgi:hypothetical protein